MRLAVLALLVPFAPSADASCAQTILVPNILTTRDTRLPSDGGVLVGYTSVFQDPEPVGSDPSEATKWTASAGKKTIALTRTLLAPGLSVYRPPATVDAFAIANSKGDGIGSFTHDTKGAATTMPAPKAKSLKLTTSQGMRWMTTSGEVTLDAAPPADAVAVILYLVDGAKTVPLSFGRLPDTHDKLTSVEVFSAGGHCAVSVPGESKPSSGDKVTFAFVDAFGRLSPQSKPITTK